MNQNSVAAAVAAAAAGGAAAQGGGVRVAAVDPLLRLTCTAPSARRGGAGDAVAPAPSAFFSSKKRSWRVNNIACHHHRAVNGNLFCGYPVRTCGGIIAEFVCGRRGGSRSRRRRRLHIIDKEGCCRRGLNTETFQRGGDLGHVPN